MRLALLLLFALLGALWASAAGGGCPDAQAVFDTTNMYRGWHQAPPLTWSASLAAAAQAYAEVLAPKGCPLIHAGVGGENLYTTTQYPKPDNTCLRAITAWYSEEPYYDYTVANAFQYNWPRGIGHFTAMVWKSGRSFGCGVARADVPMSSMPGGFAGCKIVVCRYSLPVNLADNTAFKQNVLPKV
ncbi:hypothetical protein HYH02_007837 [Chlamydomonas schloesseri]|uniref:SCP domain-containing protein n=2 Tax=Chlamydomonas schloesseri TaxID=2026947 RepID=A0A835WGI2_9CHLO|nr:hypothetical protein HYH02_007837 [Chlamydomonas schloesseri]|eukprot:KAG2447088.1 hypothetical protein HYH02_007837 [Chlamydomonas schloesseri]